MEGGEKVVVAVCMWRVAVAMRGIKRRRRRRRRRRSWLGRERG